MNFNQSGFQSKIEFQKRFLKTGILAFLIFFISIAIGILGYHFIVKLDWVDSFLNASMILGGMGQVSELKSDPEKIFAALYALFSGVTFLSGTAIFLSPIIHRLLQKFHIDFKNNEDNF